MRTVRCHHRLAQAAIVAAAVLVQTISGAVHAAEPARAEQLIRRGVELRHQGQDTRALPFFQQAYEVSPSPRTAAQLGLCEMALGYQIDSERHLAEALASPHDLWVRKNRTALEDAVAKVRQAIGQIAIRGPAGAEAFINGKSVGRLPLAQPVRVGEGPSTVELRAGAAVARRSIQVIGGKIEEVALEPVADKMAPPPLPPADAQGAGERPALAAGPSPQAADQPDEGGRSNGLRVAAWATAAGAAAALVLGGVETAIYLGRKSDFEGHRGPLRDNPSIVDVNCGAQDPGHGGEGCDALYQRMQGPRTLAVVGYAVGAGLAVGSAVLFWVSSAPPDQGAHALSCTPAWSGQGMSAQCRLTF
ncbi:MAG TPA: hypothetical protein VN914_18440 [Polyangia bacterium]|nr:hypothetical protein [Polyangia bacterium]